MCNSAPSAPQLPQYPDLTPQQQTNIGQQSGVSQQFGNVIQGTSTQLGQNQNILQAISGLFNQDGTVNPSAVTQLRQLASGQTSAAGQAGQQALSGLSGTNDTLAKTQQAYTNALQGNVPANKQLQFQQNQSFQQLKEQAAQQGIDIQGDSFDSATSKSTAGQKLLQNFQQNAGIQNQNYQLGYLGQLGTNMGQIAGTGATQANTGTGLSQFSQQTPLGYLGQSITSGQSALAPMLSQYQSQLGQAYQPLYMQQIGPYQQQMAQAQANYQSGLQQYQSNQGMMGGIGSLVGTGIGAYFGGPIGAAVGSSVGNKVGSTL